MHGLAADRVQISGQRRHQRFAFAGAHFGNLALVEHHAADQLHIEVAHIQNPPGGFTHHRKSLYEKRLSVLSFPRAAAKLIGFGTKLLIGQAFKLDLHLIDGFDRLAHFAKQALIAAAENLCGDFAKHKTG